MAGNRFELPGERSAKDELATAGPPREFRSTPEIRFDGFVVEPDTGRLREGERIVPLAPKPFDTLLYLARHAGRVVPRSELIERLWPATFVTDDVLVQSIVEIRRALGDDAKTPRYVETIPRRGYRFVAPVTRAVEPAEDGEATAAPAPAPGPAGAVWSGSPSRRVIPLAAGMLFLAALSVLGWRLRGERAAVSVDPGTLAVLPISIEAPSQQSQQDGWLRHGLAEMLRSQLGQTPGVHVVARHRVAGALAELSGADESGSVSSEAAAELARRLRAARLLTGSFVHVEDRFVLTAQIVDATSGRTEASASVRGQYPGELVEAVDELSAKLARTLRTRESGGEGWRPVRLTTRSLEASRRYTEALADFARGGRAGAEAAEGHLDRALQLDPGFAQAYVMKAQVQQWRRSWGYGSPDPAPAIAAAARLVTQLPERERRVVESFQALIAQEDERRAIELWRELLRFHPAYSEELGIPGLLAEALIDQGGWDEVVRVGEAHVESPSLPDTERARLCSALARAFERRGEIGRALQYARRAVQGWPATAGPRYLGERAGLGRLWLDASHRAEALAEFAAVRDASEADATNLTQAAWGFYMAGEPEEAERVVARALERDAAYGNAWHLRGWLQLSRGQPLAAAESLQAAFERTPRSFGAPHQGLVNGDLAAQYYAGVAWLKAGRTASARAAFEALLVHCQRLQQARSNAGVAGDWQVGNYLARAAARLGRVAPEPPALAGDEMTATVQSARLYAVQGRRGEAVRALGQGIALGFAEFQHIRDDPDFESLRGMAEFERLIAGGRSADQAAPRGGS